VPIILWTVFVWFAMAGPIDSKVDVSFGLLPTPFHPNGALILATIYGGLYLFLEPYASVLTLTIRKII